MEEMNDYVEEMIKHEPDNQIKESIADTLSRPQPSNHDLLAYHLFYSDAYHEALLEEASSNAYSIRNVHARQYHATMAAAYSALISAEVLGYLKEEWGLDEFRAAYGSRIAGIKADGRPNSSDDNRGESSTDTRTD